MHRLQVCAVIGMLWFVSAAAAADVAGVVNGRVITSAEVDQPVAAKIFALEQQIHALRRSSLENLITRAVLEDVAAKRGITVDALKSSLTQTAVSVSDEAVEQEYLDNLEAFSGMSGDEARQRVRIDLETKQRMRGYRDAVTALLQEAKVERRLPEPVMAAAKESLDGLPSLGAPDAPVVVVGFSDFQCPYCREASGYARQLTVTHGDSVRFVFRHLPLEIHDDAFGAARASYCAGRQERFWQFHDALFAANDLTAPALRRVASATGLDLAAYDGCVGSEASALAVQRDVAAARALGVDGTPTFLVNGSVLRGIADYESLRRAVSRHVKAPQVTSSDR